MNVYGTADPASWAVHYARSKPSQAFDARALAPRAVAASPRPGRAALVRRVRGKLRDRPAAGDPGGRVGPRALGPARRPRCAGGPGGRRAGGKRLGCAPAEPLLHQALTASFTWPQR